MGEFHNIVVWFNSRQIIPPSASSLLGESPTHIHPQKPALGMEQAKPVSKQNGHGGMENLVKDLSAQTSHTGPVCSLGQV